MLTVAEVNLFCAIGSIFIFYFFSLANSDATYDSNTREKRRYILKSNYQYITCCRNNKIVTLLKANPSIMFKYKHLIANIMFTTHNGKNMNR